MARITLVKKVFADGSPCRKCGEVMARLERDGHLDAIDRIVVADEREPDGEGWRLAARHQVEAAPFFLVEAEGRTTVYTIYLRFVREVLSAPVRERDELRELMEQSPDLDFI